MKRRMLDGIGKLMMFSVMLMLAVGSAFMFSTETIFADEYLIVAEGDGDVLINPGTTTHVKVPVSTIYYDLEIYSLNASASNEHMQVKGIKLTDSNGNKVNTRAGVFISTSSSYNIEFDVKSDEALEIGNYTITIKGSGIVFDDSDEYYVKPMDFLTIKTYTEDELDGPSLSITDVSYDKSDFVQDSKASIKVTVVNEGTLSALKSKLSVDFGDSGIEPDYTVSTIKVGDLAKNASTVVTIPVKLPKDITEGEKKLTVTISAKNSRGKEVDPFTQTIYVTVTKKKETVNAPKLKVTSKSNYSVLERDSTAEIPLVIKNIGNINAKKVKVSSVSGLEAAGGITKKYTGDSITIGTIKPDEKASIVVPITVGKKVEAGLKEFVFAVSFTDKDDVEYPAVNITVYRSVATEDTNVYDVKVTDVEQSVTKPVAGEAFTLSFKVRNEGTMSVGDVRITGGGFAATNFEPTDGDPYIDVGDMEPGTVKNVSIRLRCGADIPSGTNPVAFTLDYLNDAGTKVSEAVTMYVLDVEGNDSTTGKPKLIVSDYSTDKDKLQAGDTFLFSYTLKNTHATKTAKNIKITLSQADGIFSPAAGTNIFYVESIKAGEEVQLEIELLTKNNAATGDYDLKLTVEYEYDNMSKEEIEKGGVSDENLLKLHATENYRPVIENITVGGWDGSVYVGEPTDLSFEFYNMGKSKLGNVFVTVEGDFALANDANMSYVGAVDSYGQQVVTPSVVSYVEGEAKGTLVVHFEDSNGDEVTTSQDFSAYVSSYDMGGEDWDMEPEIPEGYHMDENGEIVPDDAGIPVFVWIIIGAAVVVLVVVIIVVTTVRAKKKKKSQEQLEEDEDEDY